MTREQRFLVGVLFATCTGLLFEAARTLQQYNRLVETHHILLEKHERAVEYWQAHREAIQYIFHVLEDRGVDLTEFDLIALKTIAEKAETRGGS